MRCDLHVHSGYSGRAGLPLLDHLGRECYSEPLAVYEQARRRGMDLVTLTDHDTIEGALELASRADCFVSEELTVLLDGGRQLHLNVFGIGERQHAELRHGGATRRRSSPIWPKSAFQRPSTTCSPRSPERGSSPTSACRSAGWR